MAEDVFDVVAEDPEEPAVAQQVQPAAVQVVAESAAPIVNITNDVQPAPVTVNNTHPSKAVQTVQRDGKDEIVSTTTTYEA